MWTVNAVPRGPPPGSGFFVFSAMRQPFKPRFCGIMNKIFMARPGEMSTAPGQAGAGSSEKLLPHI